MINDNNPENQNVKLNRRILSISKEYENINSSEIELHKIDNLNKKSRYIYSRGRFYGILKRLKEIFNRARKNSDESK